MLWVLTCNNFCPYFNISNYVLSLVSTFQFQTYSSVLSSWTTLPSFLKIQSFNLILRLRQPIKIAHSCCPHFLIFLFLKIPLKSGFKICLDYQSPDLMAFFFWPYSTWHSEVLTFFFWNFPVSVSSKYFVFDSSNEFFLALFSYLLTIHTLQRVISTIF